MIPTGRRASRLIVAGRIVAARIVAARIVAAGLLAGFLLAGCTVPTAPDTRTSTGLAPQPSASGAPSDGASAAPPEAALSTRVELPWPAATVADAANLQAQVDRGAQPWLLDPSEVAIAYAAAAHDWADAEAYPGPDGTSVDVRNADGERLTLSLSQPARRGDDGIWVVTAERR